MLGGVYLGQSYLGQGYPSISNFVLALVRAFTQPAAGFLRYTRRV